LAGTNIYGPTGLVIPQAGAEAANKISRHMTSAKLSPEASPSTDGGAFWYFRDSLTVSLMGLCYYSLSPTETHMLINDIKKGTRVKLRNGWFGTMADNAKGNIRMVDVEGFEREIGSVYSHDIQYVLTDAEAARWEDVELSPAQLKKANAIRQMGF
jgi:hypothetical protein